MNQHTVEDLLYKALYEFKVVTPDRGILESICRQAEKGTALTDRQFNLVVDKLEGFADVFAENNIIVTTYEPKQPLRQIDRRKYIKVVDEIDAVFYDEKYKHGWKWIAVRFPFNKKDIMKINDLQIQHKEYSHEKGSHIHHYKLTPRNTHKIVSKFINRNFTIDKSLLEYYNKCTSIIEESSKYTSSYENVFLRLDEEQQNDLVNKSDLYIADRSLRYQYKLPKPLPQNLDEIIAYRTSRELCVDPECYTLTNITTSLNNLHRYPLLVTIDEEDSFQQLADMHQNIRRHVKNEEQSVLFRIDKSDTLNNPLNDYIRNNNLNNWVDNNTKVVYIKKNKLPKILLKHNFKPICSLSKTSIRLQKTVKDFVDLYCDCIIYHDKSLSFFRSNRVGDL